MSENAVFYSIGGALIVLAVMISISYGMTLKPKGTQNQSLIGLVIASAILTGIIGWLFAVVGFKGNAGAQLQFVLAFAILILFPVSIISASVSASQLYGLRDAIAANQQTA